jgi:hypothetical protein
LGGHRFAPTALLLPDGTSWAWLDAERLERIVRRRGDVNQVLSHFRGSTAMTSPVLQVAEREVFGIVGWHWLDVSRAGTLLSSEGQRSWVRIDSPLGSWTVAIDAKQGCSLPRCGLSDDATEVWPQYVVSVVQRMFA